MTSLTPNQQKIVRQLVEQVQIGNLPEEFTVIFFIGQEGPNVGPYTGPGESGIRVSRATLDALVQADMLTRRQVRSSHICVLTGEAYKAVENNFASLAASPTLNIQDSSYLIININTTLNSAVQIVNAASQIDNATKDQLAHLLGQLKDELAKVQPDRLEDAEAVAEEAQELVTVATKERPNKRRIEITAEGLKKAAETLGKIAPNILKVAMLIVGLAGA